MSEGGGTIITGNCELALQLTQTRSLKISCYIYAGEDSDELSKRLDALQDVIDRQAVRVDIVVKEAQIDAVTANMRQYRENAAALAEQISMDEKSGRKISSQEKLQRKLHVDKLDADMRNFSAQIESLQAAIAKGKQKINGHLQA